MKFIILKIFILSLFLAGCNEPEIPQDSHLTVFPNPALHQAGFNIQNPNGENYKLLVFDTGGDLIMEETGTDTSIIYYLSLDGKPKGSYTVILKIGDDTINQRLIKL